MKYTAENIGYRLEQGGSRKISASRESCHGSLQYMTITYNGAELKREEHTIIYTIGSDGLLNFGGNYIIDSTGSIL